MTPRWARRLAAVLSWILGLGCGLPGIYAAWHLATRGEVWIVLGWPTYGKGPLEAAGVPTTVPLIGAFVVVCAAETAAGWLLWTDRRAGPVTALVVLPFELIFWTGFDLPYPPVLGAARTAAVLAATRSGGARTRRTGGPVAS